MAQEDVVVQELEEDLGTAMQKLPIPFKELEQFIPIDSAYGFTDRVKGIIEDSNLLLENSDSCHISNDMKSSQNYSNQPQATRSGFGSPPKRSRNKRGKRKQQSFTSVEPNRSCSHCGTRTTPLWREGPRGAGTLCNACGVRYRTGRLLPEYRPASSPGFKPDIHSNFHRKVMEIRRERNSPPSPR